MEMDLVLACLAILLGAKVFYVLDELFAWTPRMTEWLGRMFD